MRSMYFLLSACILFACTAAASAGEPAEQAIHGQLFPPELLMAHRDQLGLTDKQLERIRGHLEQANTDSTQAQQKVEPTARKLGELLGAESIDEAAALKQLEEVLNAERELKRLHLRVMIRIRNELTPRQQSLAARLQAQPEDDFRQRLESKVNRIQWEVERRAQAGQPPLEALQLMQPLPEQMKAGRPKEAEEMLDRVLKMLGLDRSAPPAPDKASPRKSPVPAASP